MIEATVGMENTVTKNILSKFAQNQTALMTSVNLDILILVNLAIDANSTWKKICLFSHVTPATDDEKKIEDLKKGLNQTEKENKALNSSHKDLTKQIENKFEVFNNKIELLRKTFETKENQISLLETLF